MLLRIVWCIALSIEFRRRCLGDDVPGELIIEVSIEARSGFHQRCLETVLLRPSPQDFGILLPCSHVLIQELIAEQLASPVDEDAQTSCMINQESAEFLFIEGGATGEDKKGGRVERSRRPCDARRLTTCRSFSPGTAPDSPARTAK